MDAQKVSEYLSAVKKEEFPFLRAFLRASEISACLIRIFSWSASLMVNAKLRLKSLG